MHTDGGRILMCGYTPSTQAALDELGAEIQSRGVILLTQKTVPEREGVTVLALDYLHADHLRNPRVELDECSVCIVFAEPPADGGPARTTDMRTVLAVYTIKKERPDLPMIAEVVDRENTSFIEELDCDDVIFKETIDSNLITSCILHPNISPIFYDLLTVRGKTLRSTTLADLGMDDPDVTYRDIRLRGLEQDVTYLGFIDRSHGVQLMPPNDTVIRPTFRLVYIE